MTSTSKTDALTWLLLGTIAFAAFSTYQWLRPHEGAISFTYGCCGASVEEAVLPMMQRGFHPPAEGLIIDDYRKPCDQRLIQPLSTLLWLAYSNGVSDGEASADSDWSGAIESSCRILSGLWAERFYDAGWDDGGYGVFEPSSCGFMIDHVSERLIDTRGERDFNCSRLLDAIDGMDAISAPSRNMIETRERLFAQYQRECS